MSDELLNEATNEAGQLGWIVSWRVPSDIALVDLRNALTAAGLDPALAGELRNEHALRRGLRDMSENRVIRKLRREGQYVYFQLTHEQIADYAATYSREAELCLDTDTGHISADDEEIAKQARLLLAEHLSKRLTSDLTKLVQRVYDGAKADLIPIREQGGAYFVPQEHSRLVEQSRELLEAIGGKLRSFAVKLGSGETRESVAESMAEYFAQLIEEFREACAKLSSETRQDVKERRIAYIGDLRRKLECYRGLMAGMADSIGIQITAAESEMLAALFPAEPASV